MNARILLAAVFLLSFSSAAAENERPDSFVLTQTDFDYTFRKVDIPMRDGVKLHAIIMVPHGAARAPILLTRTPYDATALTSNRPSSHMIAMLDGYDNASDIESSDGYIRVVEDVRGKYNSGGDYVMNRPWKGPLNDSATDHPTDTYDTIDWLIHNIPETNGRVGMLGISYDGFTTLMGMIHPHPALRAVVPMNPMVDGWMGDDWFHHGAFREINLSYVYEQEATRDNTEKWWETHYDDYDMYLSGGSTGDIARAHGLEQTGFYRKLVAHPDYDSFWQDQAVDKKLAAEPLTVPTLLVHSLWDQEDIYGDIAVWKAIKPKDMGHNVFLAMGPWHHGGEIHDGSTLGDVHFDSDTALWFRRHVLRPFLAHYLKDEAPPLTIATVTAFESGTNEWRNLPSWPAGCESGCTISAQKLRLLPDFSLGLGGAATGTNQPLDYVSDPAHPIPYHSRPIHYGEEDDNFWHNWLADDQREASTRTDVLTFATPILTQPVHIAGEPVADLLAATTGSDGDFIVKLIDVYPDEVPIRPRMSGYQLMVSADVLRGRYREDPSKAHAIPPGQALRYRFPLPTANHVFLPGHRIMVQVQSTWFPLVDRNPQKFVDNIFLAKPGDYQKARVSIMAGGVDGSFVGLPVVVQQ